MSVCVNLEGEGMINIKYWRKLFIVSIFVYRYFWYANVTDNNILNKICIAFHVFIVLIFYSLMSVFNRIVVDV